MTIGKIKITIYFAIFLVISCVTENNGHRRNDTATTADTASTIDTASIDKWAWVVPVESNPLLTIQDINRIPIDSSATTLISAYEKETILVANIIKPEHRKLMLKHINQHGLKLERLHIGKPEKGVVNAVGLYIDSTLWKSFRTYSAGGMKRSGITRITPSLNGNDLDSFFVANFNFTPEMIDLGLHGRLNVGVEIYPRDSILKVFQVDIFEDTLGVSKEITRVLNLMKKWSPSYDSLTKTLHRDEMVYPFPIQHPDSARLKPYIQTH